MITAQDKHLAEEAALHATDEDARAANARLLRHAKPFSDPPATTPPALYSDCDPQKTGALQNSCNVPAETLQPLSTPTTEVADRLLHVIEVLGIAHAEIQDELSAIFREVTPPPWGESKAERPSPDQLITALTKLRKHSAIFSDWLIQAEKVIRTLN